MGQPVRLPQDTALVIIEPVDQLDAAAAVAVAGLLAGWRDADMPRVRISAADGTREGGEPVIRRSSPSVFGSTALDSRLTAAGITTLVFCGSNHDGALGAALREAAERGYRVVVAGDGCAPAAPDDFAARAKLAAAVDILNGLALLAARKRPWPTVPAKSL
ncbi:isochorismatase family protein [Chelatococcus sp. GCM10030263]|uniref:isochorismatase family protein n=1 Tax=Chelatococcus sp. GCM10030263 TaxID=3273387 RepID=UPI00361C3F3B